MIEMNMLILLNKNNPAVSETFIQSHIDYFKAQTKNIYNYTNSIHSKKKSSPLLLYYRLREKIGQYKFKRYVRKQKINVVLAEYGMVGADALKLCKQNKLPLVVHFHGYDAHRKTLINQYTKAYKELFDYAKLMVAVSTKMYDQLIKIGSPAEKTIVNVYGVNINKFSKKDHFSANKKIIAVGRFVDKKAPYLTILAFEIVLKKYPDAILYFIGDGYLFETCKRIARAIKIDSSVIFLGEQNQEEVKKYMENCSIFVQHSVESFDGDSEGTPVSVLEACSLGLAVVATRHAGIADVIVHEENGLLINEGNVNAMAANIISLLENPQLAVDLGQKARRTIEERYTLEKSLARLEKSIKKAIV